MIIQFQNSQIIQCPREKVFAFLADFTHMPMWNYYIQSVTKISEGPVGLGTVFEQKRPHDLYRYKIVVYEPLQTIRVELQPPGPNLLYGFKLSGYAAQTQVTMDWQLNLDNYSVLKYVPKGLVKNWLLSLVDWQIQAKTKPATMENFNKLKILLETGEVTLQSGRRVVLGEKLDVRR